MAEYIFHAICRMPRVYRGKLALVSRLFASMGTTMKIKRSYSARFVLCVLLAVSAVFCLRNVASPVHAEEAPGGGCV